MIFISFRDCHFHLFHAPLYLALPFCPFSHQLALSAGRGLAGVGALLDLGDEKLKALADVLVVAGAGLGVAAVVLFRQLAAVLGRDLALLGSQIALVAHNDNGHPVGAEVVQNLLSNNLDHLKRGQRGDRVYEHVAVYANKMLRV